METHNTQKKIMSVEIVERDRESILKVPSILQSSNGKYPPAHQTAPKAISFKHLEGRTPFFGRYIWKSHVEPKPCPEKESPLQTIYEKKTSVGIFPPKTSKQNGAVSQINSPPLGSYQALGFWWCWTLEQVKPAVPGEHGETGEVGGTFSNPSVEGDSEYGIYSKQVIKKFL